MTYKLCVQLDYDSVPYRLTNSRSEIGGKGMIAMLSDAYPDYTYKLVSDGPTVAVDLLVTP